MPTSAFLLDTNAYALLFQSPKNSAQVSLEKRIQGTTGMSFYLPEIVSMEIYSVLGSYFRGGNPTQEIECDRDVRHSDRMEKCGRICVLPARKRMKPKVFRGLLKLVKDIEAERGQITATLLPTNSSQIRYAQEFLTKYADRFAFGSHDAMVAGAIRYANNAGLGLTLVTSDKGLKAVCRASSIGVFDPREAT